jgi:O-antigen ligase/tetratricopeptide (TPR) repeat protein
MRSRDVAALVAVAVALTLTTALVGGATRWAALAAVVLALATAVPHLGSRRTASRPGPLLRLVGLAGALTALQLVPMPEMIAEIVIRPRLELARGHAAAFGEPLPTWTVASYDPPATLVELTKLAGYLALAWTAGRLAAQRRARPWLAACVVAAAAIAVAIGAAHLAVGADRLYGVFAEPPPDHVTGPLVNDNHFASLCALAAPLALGLALAWSGRLRAAAALAGLVLAAAALLSGSRGGALALAAGLAVTAILLVLQRRTGTDDDADHRRRRSAFPAAIIAGSIVLILGLVVTSDVTDELRDTRLSELAEPRSKYQVWTAALPLVGDNRWLGIGKGAFETTYPTVAPVGDVTFSHAENSYLQAVIDWGVPGAAALLVLVLVLGREALRRWRHGPLEAGALGGLTAVALHELVDFSLELPAVAMATICVAAIVAPARVGTDGAPLERRTRVLRHGGLALAGLLVVLAAALGGSAVRDRARLPADSEGDAGPARAALARHPADGLAAGHAAQALFAVRDQRAVAVVARALSLRPKNSGLHRLAARMLVAGARPAQAQLEYRLALAWCDDREATDILDEIVARFPDPAAAANALPTEPRQSWRLQKLLAARGRTEVALAYAARVLVFEPGRADAHLDLALAALRLGRHSLAREHALAAHRAAPTTTTALTLARAQAATGERPAAIATLRAAPATRDAITAADVAAELAAHLRATGDLEGARQVLLAAIDATPAPAIEAVLRRHFADVEEAMGNPRRAELERRLADELARPAPAPAPR